jgi:serine/threonine-protein kinase RIM15
MPFVRRHVTRRLKAAKAECDKELQRVTNSITAFFEERLRDGDETEREVRERERERDRESQNGDAEHSRDGFFLHASDLRSALQTDESSSDGGYEAEVEYSRHSRQRAFPDEPDHSAPSLTHWSSSPGLLTASSASSSPSSLRRQQTLPLDRPLSSSTSSAGVAGFPSPESNSGRKQSNAIAPAPWSVQGISRRLSRSIHIPVRTGHSAQSSRSTSRSRSPLPPTGGVRTSFSESLSSASGPNRRSSRLLLDNPIDPIMTVLYELIAVSTDVVDMSITQLTAQPKVCESVVQRVQSIGKAWDEHPDWHGRNWYVQVLLAVASLSRVVEWWEAEKQFWNFDDNDDELDEPLAFVTKPADEDVSLPSLPVKRPLAEFDLTKLSLDESKTRLTRPPSQGRRPRDEQPKLLSTSAAEPEQSHGSTKTQDNNESARVLATERLRLQAETAQNQNIVMELSLDGDHFIWINYAWRVVVG